VRTEVSSLGQIRPLNSSQSGDMLIPNSTVSGPQPGVKKTPHTTQSDLGACH
jgi:hypothetical protein